MKISNKQKQALEIISGKPWDSWNMSAVDSYFAYTDRGERTPLFNKVWKLQLPGHKFNEAEQSLWDLMQCHTFHPVTVEMWKQDFLSHGEFPPLLYLWEFIGQGYPDAFVKHVFEIYKEVRGYIPIDEVSGIREEAQRLGLIER
jgi:hypothetical protein